jgi:hypothetical protein
MRKKPPYDGHNRKPINRVKLARHRYARRLQRADRRLILSTRGGVSRYYLT